MTGDHRGYDYDYDYENRLIRITKNSGATTVADFEYDALGRRIQVRDYEDGTLDKTETMYYNGRWQILYKYHDWEGSGAMGQDFVYGNYLDEVLRFDWVIGGEAMYPKYYVHDHLFSVVSLLDDTGDLLERFD